MTIKETWKLEMKNPFNTQKATLYLFVEGNMITGRMEDNKGGASDIKDGKIDGDILVWKASRKILTFEFNVKVDGDTMLGTVKSRLGRASLKGTRITHEISS